MTATTGGGSLDILLADDNADAATSLAMLLEMDGHRVRTAADGEGAVAAVAAARPVVAILDLGMPRVDGLEAARRIRALPGGRGIVLVALTGWGLDDDLRRAKEAGFDHHLLKPVRYDAVAGILAGVSTRQP